MFVFIPVLQTEDCLCVFDSFGLVWPGASLPRSAWARTQMVGDTAGWGATPRPNYLSVSPHFTAFPPPLSLWVFTSFLCISTSHSSVPPPVFSLPPSFPPSFPPSLPPSLPSIHPSIHLSLSLMNISQRNAIYRRGIAPPLHPSSSDFSSARLFSRYQIEVEFHVNFNHHQFSE